MSDPNPAREADGRTDREALNAYDADVAMFELVDAGLGGSHDDAASVASYLIANRDAVLRALGLREERGVRAVNRPIIVNSGDSDDPDVLAAKYDGQAIRRFLSDWEDA